MRCLITGAAGFIGSHLADRLRAGGHEVVGIDNLSTGRAANFAGDLVVGDICDGLPAGPFDVVYHCAASYRDKNDWERDARTNVLGTIAVVRAALGWNARLVYFQTSLCYGPNPASPVQTDAPLGPRGSYAVSKTAGETYIRDSGLDWVSLRLANIYGPRNLSGPVPTFYQRLTQGLPCTIVDSRRDFVFIDDLLRVAVHAIARGRGIYHVSSGTDQSIADIYDAVAGALGMKPPPVEIIARGADDVATLLLDPIDTLQEFGWTAKTPLVTGIHEAVEWYRTHGVTETFTHLTMKG